MLYTMEYFKKWICDQLSTFELRAPYIANFKSIK